MSCRNPNCPRQHVAEDELIRLTIKQLQDTPTPIEITSKLGAASSCAKCANEQISAWLSELLYLRTMRSKFPANRDKANN